MVNKYRCAIIGCGDIAGRHAEAYANIDSTTLTAICDMSEERLTQFGNIWKVEKRYADLADMMRKERIDIVSVCTWTNSHYAIVKELASLGGIKAILCEKSLAMNAHEAMEMVAMCQSQGILLIEAFKIRHHPQHLLARELVQSNALGKIYYLRTHFTSGYWHESNWRINKNLGGGVIRDFACYAIDWARFVTGKNPLTVFADITFGKKSEVDEIVTATLAFPDDVVMHLHSSFHYPCGNEETAEIFGTDGLIRIKPFVNPQTSDVRAMQILYKDGRDDTRTYPLIDQVTLEVEHLIKYLETGRSNRTSPMEGVINARIIDAFFTSNANGRKVELDYSDIV